MKLIIKSDAIWVAATPVDFRLGIFGLSSIISTVFGKQIPDGLYIFYNKARNKIKCLARHHQGSLLIYKTLDRKTFVFNLNETTPYQITESEFQWLLAGLDWRILSADGSLFIEDFF